MENITASFVKSSPDYRQCPEPVLPEYAFIGRSNVGKSSLINMLTAKKNLAKISGTPGKTQLINHFIINDLWYLVDLPGYGFAKTSKKNREAWEKMIDAYLVNRENLVSTFILIDARHEPLKIDMDFIRQFGVRNLPFSLVFTKTDKLSKKLLQKNMQAYSKRLLAEWEDHPLSLLTSAKTGLGKDDLLNVIYQMNEQKKSK